MTFAQLNAVKFSEVQIQAISVHHPLKPQPDSRDFLARDNDRHQ
jgi:hypothetical protein